MNQQQFRQGEVIFREWTLGNELYELKSGKVGIFSGYGTQGERLLTELEAGRIFGELAVIDLEPRSATAVALSDVTAVVFSGSDLRDYLNGDPGRLKEVMRSMSRRLRELTDDYMDVCSTIRAMDRSRKNGTARDKGLLAKIRRFIQDFNDAQTAMIRMGVPITTYYSGWNY